MCLLVAALAAAFAFQRPLLRRFVLPGIERELSGILGLKASIDEARVELDGALIVSGVVIEGGEPRTAVQSARIERAVVHLSPLMLLLGRGGGASAPGAHPLELPGVEIEGGELTLRTSAGVIRMQGVDLRIQGHDVALRVQWADGDWKPPRLDALRFPLEAHASFEAPGGALRARIHRLNLAGREHARDFRVEVRQGGAVELAGDLSGWGARLEAGSLVDGVLDLDLQADGAPLRSIVSLFTEWKAPEASGWGRFRLVLPLESLSSWRVEADLELRDVGWPEEGLSAPLARIHVRREAPELVLAGDALLEGVVLDAAAGHGLPALDAVVRFRRIGTAGAELVIIDEAALAHEGGVVDVRGTLRERGLFWEGAEARTARLALGVADGTVLAGAAVSWQGSVLEPASLLASLHGRLEDTGGAWGVDAAGRLGACVLRIDEGHAWRGGGEARFALALSAGGTGLPAAATFERLEASLGGVEAAAVIPPSLEASTSALVLHPCAFSVLGGLVRAEGVLDASLDGEASVEWTALDLSLLEQDQLPGTRLQGMFSGTARYWSGERQPLQVHAGLEGGVVEAQGARWDGLHAELEARATRDSIDVTELRVSRAGSEAHLELSVPASWGPLPIPEPGSQIEGRFHVDVRDVAELSPPLREIRELGGRIVASGAVRAEASPDPALLLRSVYVDGLVSVHDGRLKRADETPPVTELEANLRVAGKGVSIRSAGGKLRDAQFRLEGEGQVAWPWEPGGLALESASLRLHSKSALLVRRPNLRARGDVDLRLRVSPPVAELGGTIDIGRAYWLEDMPLLPSREARLPLRLFSFTEPPLDSLRLDVRIRSDRGIHVRNNVVSTRATADLVLGGTGREPVLTGTLSTDEGTVRFADSNLSLRGSYVELRRDDPLNPRLQILIGETIRGYAVSLSITGTLEAPEVLLDSSPPLEREKVLVLITTGLTLDEIEDRGVSRVAAVKATKYVGLRIVRYFSQGDPTDRSFLDRFSLETDNARSARLEDPIRVEYRLIENLIRDNDELFLQGERDSYGDYNFNLGVRFELD